MEKKLLCPISIGNLAVGDSEGTGVYRSVASTRLNDRGLKHFSFILTSYTMNWGEVKITNFYNDVKWYFPNENG